MVTNFTCEIMPRADHSAEAAHKGLLYRCSVYYYSPAVKQFRVDDYVVETLLPDLVLHDRQPSAFLVYLHLWYRSAGRAAPVRASHQDIVSATGLSKSAVQAAVRTLIRRRLL